MFSGSNLEASDRLPDDGQQLPAVLHFVGNTHPGQAKYISQTTTCQNSEEAGGRKRENTGNGSEGGLGNYQYLHSKEGIVRERYQN